MWDSLIASVEKCLHAACKIYGDGELTPRPLSLPELPGPLGLPPLSGEFAAALGVEVGRHNALLDKHGETGALVASLTAEVGDSHTRSRKALAVQSAEFEASVAALAPFAGSPLALFALFLSAGGVLGTVTEGITRDMGLMTNVAKQIPGQPSFEPRGRAGRQFLPPSRGGAPIRRASSYSPAGYRPAGYQPSNGISAQERYEFRRRLASYNGSVPGMAYALAVEGMPYVWGYRDCSKVAGDIGLAALGYEPGQRLFTTHNAGEVLASLGARPGLGPGLNFGINPEHMALTLSDGTNVEATPPLVLVGDSARGADDPSFVERWHLPPELLVGGSAPSDGFLTLGRGQGVYS